VKLDIQLDAEIVAPGEELTGHVRVLEGGASRSLTLTVSFCERSPAFLTTPFSERSILFEGDLAGGPTGLGPASRESTASSSGSSRPSPTSPASTRAVVGGSR